jgi:photosystem II stability/assembly factor-like uncharacterized protein
MTILLLAILFSAQPSRAHARWDAQSMGTTARLRGVSAVSAGVAWASGERGTFARTTDGGLTWRAGVVPGAEELDFRDVDAFDAETAYLLSAGEGARSRIYKTTDGGRSWTLQFQNTRAAAFFDAMAFWDRSRGVAFSDPVDGRFLVVATSDGGATWRETPAAGMPRALAGEAGFAASGTSLAVRGRGQVWFGTGGPGGARVFRSADGGRTWDASRAPLAAGASAGVFSLAFLDARRGVAVGGDYTKETSDAGNVAVTDDGGRTWRAIRGRRPGGYRSCVALFAGADAPASRNRTRAHAARDETRALFARRASGILVAVGPSGSDYSADAGESWTPLGAEGFHSAAFARGAGWAVGEAGRVARYERAAATTRRARATTRTSHAAQRVRTTRDARGRRESLKTSTRRRVAHSNGARGGSGRIGTPSRIAAPMRGARPKRLCAL